MIEQIHVPSKRVRILVGRGGEVLKQLRKETKTLIHLEDQNVTIEGEALNVWNAKNVISAIIHGFTPEKAFTILDGRSYKVIDLTEHIPKNRLETIKSRIIGKNGRTRELLEQFTEASISVEDKTMAIICKEETLDSLLEALEMFISGISHRAVYKFLEKGGKHG